MADVEASSLGGRIRALRYRQGLTQAQLAHKAGVGEKTLKRLETGKTDTPHPETLAAVAGALGLRTEDLFESTEPAPEVERVAQLPSPPANFKGRERELTALREALADPQTVSACVQGMGGVGKTALVLALAEELSVEFPDGQFHLDLRGQSEPLRPTQAMLHVVRSLQPGRAGLETDAEVAAAYRSALRGKRMLLLLDNTSSRQQLEPLIPPEGSVLLTTSRQRFALPGMFALPLSPLPPLAARALLESLAPHVKDNDEEIADLCGGLPLALSLAGRALAERPDLDPDEFAARLRNDADRLAQLDEADGSGGVEASFQLSYDDLDATLQQALALLTVFPNDFDRAAAASVWDVSERDADTQIGRLLRLNLLEFNGSGASARYGLHDLVRLFLERKLDEGARASGRERHQVYYLGLLEECDERFRSGQHREGLQQLDREALNVEVAFERAVAAAEEDAEAAGRCCRFALAADVLRLHQHSAQRVDWCERALRVAQTLGRRRQEGRLRVQLARAELALGNARRAVEHGEAGLEAARETDDRPTEARAMVSIGNAYHALGNAQAAIRHGQEGLSIARELDSVLDQADAQVVLAWGHFVLGEMGAALRAGQGALPLAESVADPALQASALLAMGFAHQMRGEGDKVEDCAERCLRIARATGDRRTEGYALLLSGTGDRKEECCEESRRIAREVGDRRIEGNALLQLGNLRRMQGQLDEATDYYQQGLAVADETGDQRMESTALLALGLAYTTTGTHARAIEVYERHRALVDKLGNERQQALGDFLLSAAYEAAGQLDAAVGAAERLLAYQERSGHPQAAASKARLKALRAKAG